MELLACPALPVPIQPASAPASAVDKYLCGASALSLVLLPFGMGDACNQLHRTSDQEAPSPSVAEGRLPGMLRSTLLSSTKKYFPPFFKTTNSPNIFWGYMLSGSVFLSILPQSLACSSCSPVEPAGKCSVVRWGCGMEAQPSPPRPSVP